MKVCVCGCVCVCAGRVEERGGRGGRGGGGGGGVCESGRVAEMGSEAGVVLGVLWEACCAL